MESESPESPEPSELLPPERTSESESSDPGNQALQQPSVSVRKVEMNARFGASTWSALGHSAYIHLERHKSMHAYVNMLKQIVL